MTCFLFLTHHFSFPRTLSSVGFGTLVLEPVCPIPSAGVYQAPGVCETAGGPGDGVTSNPANMPAQQIVTHPVE